jgi:nitrate/nitrite-specific signal transduction histidine kinase
MCAVCYECWPVDKAWVDEDGQAWDECEHCKAIEWAVVRERKLKEEIAELVEEVKAMEWTETALRDAVAERDRRLKVQGQRIAVLYAELAELHSSRIDGRRRSD